MVDLPTYHWLVIYCQYRVNINGYVMMMVFMMVNNNLLGGFSEFFATPLKNDGVRQLGL